MKDTLLKIAKYLLFLTLAALVVLLLFGVTFFMSWPWWVGLFLVLAAVGLLAGLFFLKRLLTRRREQQFVQQVIEQDNERMASLAAAEQAQGKELQQRWKEAVDTVRRSHLKKQGNPLYVLPWYLMMGESGSGKTTALNSAKLISPFGEVHRTSGISGTRNCDWWFFDQSIIIDTAGRYALPVDSGRDGDEWQKFLSLLVKYRRREPIHGLIMTVAADKLLTASPETLEQDGQQLRRRLDELMRVLGIRFPVYLLVTKCDLIQGMTQFTGRLPEKALAQPMGAVNRELTRDVAAFLQGVLSGVADRLKGLRILMLHQHDRGPLPAGALLFPDEFQGVKPGLEAFVRGAFQENRYQETPVLRGVYFSSGKQEGTPFSHFLGNLGLIPEKDVLPGTSNGLFLHDFFDKVLPADRALLAPTSHAIQWQALTRNLGLTSWIVVWIALCGLMSYSFVRNMSTIRIASGVIARTPELKGELVADMGIMEQYRRMIISVEEKNRDWWVPRFWLVESLKVEGELKAKYCRQFRERFLASFDRTMGDSIALFTPGTPDEVAGQYMVHLTRRINLLKLRLQNAAFEKLASRPLPSYVFASLPQGEGSDIGRRFGSQYLNYLLWRGDSAEISGEITVLQSLLKHIVAVKGASLRWLPEWVNRQGIAPPLTLQSFWGGSRPAGDDVVLPPAFTKKGRDAALGFVEELKGAYPEPGIFEREEGSFQSWYRDSCYASWVRFASAFPKGEERLNGAREWKAVAEVMATEQGPYFAFLNRAAAELEAFGPPDSMPPLLQQIFQYRLLKAASAAASGGAKGVEAGKNLTAKVGDLIGKPVVGSATAQSGLAAAKAVQEYQGALSAIAPAARSRTQAFQMASQVFSEDATVSKSPFYLAYDASQRLKGEIGGGHPDEGFTRLQSGPLHFLWHYVQKEAACAVQTQWEEQVLKEAQGATDPQMLQYLVAQEGPVWKFVGSLGAFQGWSPARGYYSKTALGGTLGFEPSFFSFLSKGAKAKVALAQAPAAKPATAPVTIKGFPTDANPEARVKPQGTHLELQCASGAQSMENLNYPVSKTFIWSGDSCGDVTFQIDIGDVVLTRQYHGPGAFPAFLKEFQGGRHTFYSHDFPRERVALERMGVRYIRANYQFSGIVEILKQSGAGGGSAAPVPAQIPRTIARCWD
ncbi:type VI secretion system protein ImpL [Geomonas sp. RF6]|uniref:type VI secretion protein IcmF/TssM N-terminal domain-containing protein n=1 Tax=Geomonas sp. RF6 TaxID=2897342 RepID=UPI001E31E3F5|nr:type VI secretion protein IcmF/TssM N-terminal domain-containing protein [Geomonas sp. RF6]UFS70722.1 type VI secretion system protein ImpL [Geomonas sp. RF6]